MPNKRKVFFVSDHTGLTVEAMGRSLLSQFSHERYETRLLPFIADKAKAEVARKHIARAVEHCERTPLVFSTIVRQELRETVARAGGHFFDFFATFTGRLEAALGATAVPQRGQFHGIGDRVAYDDRIRAVHFALENDDGANLNHYDAAEIILIGVSRTGKTPTGLYLGMQYGILAANYPLTDDDETSAALPTALKAYRRKLFGLTIEPQQLERIRKERRPNGRYASPEQCQFEVERAENLFRRHAIPFVDTSSVSIEEIAGQILQITGLKPRCD